MTAVAAPDTAAHTRSPAPLTPVFCRTDYHLATPALAAPARGGYIHKGVIEQ